MPSRKQRRRREKAKRHEYEYVLVDETGNEVEIDPSELREQKEKERPKARGRSGRPAREVKPPSWSRAARRALLFAPLLFIFLSIGKNPPPVAARLGIAALYAGIFVPMFFWVDRFAYRAYRKRLERG
jgi:hypothetical protein